MTTTAVKRKLAVLLPAGGYPEQIDLIANGDGFTALQNAVEGYVQVVPLSGEFVGLDLWVNEEGKLIGLPFNELATLLWEESYGRGTDLMVGNAVVTRSANSNGTTPSMTEKQIQRLLDELITKGRKARW
jgi:hypothetical protein